MRNKMTLPFHEMKTTGAKKKYGFANDPADKPQEFEDKLTNYIHEVKRVMRM